jgi:hypothetical protein
MDIIDGKLGYNNYYNFELGYIWEVRIRYK